jgi:hypothetical protein
MFNSPATQLFLNTVSLRAAVLSEGTIFKLPDTTGNASSQPT